MNGRILSIATQPPAYTYDQHELLGYMQDFHQEDAKVGRQLNVLYKRSGIRTRNSVLPDFRNNGHAPQLFPNGPLPGLNKRLAIYQEEAISLGTQAAQQAMEGWTTPGEITDIIAVSCTGLFAPGLEFQLLKSLGLTRHVQRHPINFVGCYAAIPALHLANLICGSNPLAKVLLVSVELCSIHMQPDTDRDTLTANAIFADGAAAAVIVGKDVEAPKGLALGHHLGEVHPQGEADMSWTPAERGFLMRLSSYVPHLIHEEIRNFVLHALQRAHLQVEDVDWAFHPGGLQILDKISQAMELSKDSLAHSYNTLADHGNMSSATLLYVLKSIMETDTPERPILCAAFGPGLTFESIILNHV